MLALRLELLGIHLAHLLGRLAQVGLLALLQLRVGLYLCLGANLRCLLDGLLFLTALAHTAEQSHVTPMRIDLS